MARILIRDLTALKRNIVADRSANPRDPRSQALLLGLRVCQFAMRDLDNPRRASFPLIVLYRFFSEIVCGLELRPKTWVGEGLSIYHGFGLVVNDHAVLGKDVKLRNGVVIGHQREGGGCPVIGDGVEFGAGAIVLGDLIVGAGAVIGAGSVVTHSVPERATVVGVPAKVVRES